MPPTPRPVRKPASPTRRVTLLAAVLSAAAVATAAAPVAHADASGPRRLTGTLPNGATWVADVPANYNGVLVLYSHGYNPPGSPNPPTDQPGPEAGKALLDRGYALAGSSYATAGWTMATAADDQLGTLAAVTERIGRPKRTIALGTSMGGLVTAQLAERGAGRIDGAVATCGLVAGGIGLLDSQLDGAHALARLLLPGQEVKLTGYGDAAEAVGVAVRLREAMAAAQQTAQGRARIALAAALFHAPTWYGDDAPPGARDWTAQVTAQQRWLADTLPFILPARYDIERHAGGNPSTNEGVDYRALLRRSATSRQVRELYRAAGADLDADLARLTATASTTADARARAWVRRTSTVSGRLRMPVLSVHTTADGLVPVQFEDAYADRVRAARSTPLFRTAYVARTGHCTFTAAELVASVQAMNVRLDRGRWGSVATAEWLDAAAEKTGLGAGDYVRHRPGEFLGDEGR
ncbi:hypothetical protein ABZ801_24230 [Actinomadura sp. NPDC047616]|uniref:alpha/beta fold hydrolase n=1 Tax=Actinomadura sp. NPDC047616 TaxID=3155914 RepID=UPI0033E05F81